MDTSSLHQLTAEQELAWVGLTSMMTRLSAALDRQLQRDADISLFQYQVLAALSMHPHHTLSMGDLAKAVEASPSRLSHSVSRLEQHGWVTRTPDPTHGRSILAALTNTGRDKLVANTPGHVAAVRALVIDSLTETQLHQLIQITQNINNACCSKK
ncbi:MarR family winged helix-turn-helix transcriptional regulator [Nocardiopsis synnemataformans]|uniref:MarR family winged helix-turn-helix transcriptional regulator n=1 Tax=Nocardiopsis synnemataformans TaxID=61305 RepID=UPI003EB71409